jgi:signal peptidase
VGHLLGIALLLVIVLPFVLYALPQLIGAEYSYVVLSGSMQPALDPGDITFVDSVEAEAIERGDVINFKRASDTRTTTHRVIEVVEQDGERAFRTKGDNNEDPDQGVVTSGELRGRVMTVGGVLAAVPLVGYAIQYAATQIGFTLLFVVPVTLLVINEVWGVISSARTADEDSPDDGSDADSPESVPVEEREDTETAETAAGVSFSPNELRLGAGVLVAFVTYSAWTAVADPGPLRIGVTGSAAVALALVGGLYVLGSTNTDSRPAAGGSDADSTVARIQTETLPEHESIAERETVSSLDALVTVAENTDGRVRRDPDAGTYHVDREGTLYVYPPVEPESHHATGDTDGSSDMPTAGANVDSSAKGPSRNGPDVSLDTDTEADDD